MTTTLRTAHVFWHQWPRLKEGLTHKEEIYPLLTPVDYIHAPPGAYIRFGVWWYYKPRQTASKHGPQKPLPIIHVPGEHIPKDIRALALILNI